jgi:hypothetical protein
MWPFSKRRRYNGDVAAMLPALGIDLEQAGTMKVLDALDIAYREKYTVYEAALFIAYSCAGGLYKQGHARKALHLLKQRIGPVQADWIKKGIVRANLVNPWMGKVEETIGQQLSQRTSKPTHHVHGANSKAEPLDCDPPTAGEEDVSEFLYSLPDFTNKEIARAFRAGAYVAMLVRDLPTFMEGQRLGKNPIRYIYVMTVRLPSGQSPTYFVTLEKSQEPHPFMCIFQMDGTRKNLGRAPQLLDEDNFVANALRLITVEFKIQEKWEEVDLKPST